MSDLISRQDAIRAVANYLWHYPNEQYKNLNVFEVGEALVKDALSIVPSADRPTGEWIEVDCYESEKHSVTDMRCSLCGKYASVVLPHRTRCVYNFCPNCGAKMKGGTE